MPILFTGYRRSYRYSPLATVVGLLGFALIAWLGISSWWTNQRMAQEHVVARFAADEGAALSLSPGDYKIYCDYTSPGKYHKKYEPSVGVVDLSSKQPVYLAKRPFQICPLWAAPGRNRVELETFTVAGKGSFLIKSAIEPRNLDIEYIVTGPLHWIFPLDAAIWSASMVILMLLFTSKLIPPTKAEPAADDAVIDAMYAKLNPKKPVKYPDNLS